MPPKGTFQEDILSQLLPFLASQLLHFSLLSSFSFSPPPFLVVRNLIEVRT